MGYREEIEALVLGTRTAEAWGDQSPARLRTTRPLALAQEPGA